MGNTRKIETGTQPLVEGQKKNAPQPDPATVAGAKLQEAIKPKIKDKDDGLKLQRAQKAASNYCEYYTSKGYYNKDVKACTDETTKKIMGCEDFYTNSLSKPPEEAEKICLGQHAKINKPTKEMKKTASDYCEFQSEEADKKKSPAEMSQCTTETEQELADCEGSISNSKNAKEICIKNNAHIVRPTKTEQKAAAEFCKEVNDYTPACIKKEARDIASCRDIDMDVYQTPQEVATDKCIKENKEKGEKIKARDEEEQQAREQLKDTLKDLKKQLEQQRLKAEPSEDRIKRERLKNPSYEES